MRENFERSFAATIKHEGGYVDHPKDPGGATNLGITIGTLSSWLGRPATKAEVRALTIDGVKPIYRANYWNAVKGDDLPGGVDFAVYDFAVNSGPARSAIYLQNIVGAAPDGKIGPLTIEAVNAYCDQFGAGQLVNELCSQRLAFLERLSTWPTFGKGWGIRIAGVRKMGLEMAENTPAKPVEPPKPAPAPSEPRIHPSGPNTLWALIIAAFVLAIVAAYVITNVRF